MLPPTCFYLEAFVYVVPSVRTYFSNALLLFLLASPSLPVKSVYFPFKCTASY